MIQDKRDADCIPTPFDYDEMRERHHAPAVLAEVHRLVAEMQRFIPNPSWSGVFLFPVILQTTHSPDHLRRGVAALFRSRKWVLTYESQDGVEWISLLPINP